MDERQSAADHELVARCLEGDEAAWETLIARHERLLYSVARRAGLSHEDAADVFQRVCVRLYHWLPTIREPERVAAWLFVTTRNEAIRQSRRARREVSFDPSDAETAPWRAEPLDVRPPADEELLDLERAEVLERAIDELPERCRVLLRAFLAGDTANYRELAEKLGMPIGSIGPVRARCLSRLRQLLRERGVE
jgi:RNA polymerase sigma factor (sigma-70 family)